MPVGTQFPLTLCERRAGPRRTVRVKGGDHSHSSPGSPGQQLAHLGDQGQQKRPGLASQLQVQMPGARCHEARPGPALPCPTRWASSHFPGSPTGVVRLGFYKYFGTKQNQTKKQPHHFPFTIQEKVGANGCCVLTKNAHSC